MAAKTKHPIRTAGFEFGDWVVIESRFVLDSKGHRYRKYLCKCKGCGNSHLLYVASLENGHTQSCIPCANARIVEEQNGVYVRFKQYERNAIDRLANRYYAIVSRCRGVGRAGKWYGGRGIKCEFNDVYDFVQYCLSLEGWDKPELEIDRTNNDGNYVKGNIRFVTKQVNLQNRRVRDSECG